MNEIYEVTMKKMHENPMKVLRMSVVVEGNRTEAAVTADQIAEKLGLKFEMSYIIRGYKQAEV